MDIKDLLPGDVLLFSGLEDSAISDSILYLTKSTVSHAAMAYAESSDIVEETPPSVQVNNAWDRFEGRTISVMRQYPPQQTYSPVLEAASKYLNYNHPYSNGSLYVLGLLLLYRKFNPGIRVQKVMAKVFKKLASELLNYIDQYVYPGKSPIVCSQFVYRCYEDAGDEYRLSISNQNSGLSEYVVPGGNSLLRRVIDRVKNDKSKEFHNYISKYLDTELGVELAQNDEELACELLSELKSDAVKSKVELDYQLISVVHAFSQAMYTAMTGIKIDYNELEKANSKGMVTSGLSLMCIEEGDFVTPSDLLNNCTNLRRVGEICI